jgi:hypothetical protein
MKVIIDKIDNQLRWEIDNKFISQLGWKLYWQLSNQLYNQLRWEIDNKFISQLDNQLDSQLRKKLNK